ncbi:hypothetical protein [Pedobacter aquatilis]|uniref:hypothetical protein n=1 Tax=Pedobacter aquatilis TaxID=351343 RepID=UPI00292DC628|nr:hypothetical protein [Pedobacter aquatilis]
MKNIIGIKISKGSSAIIAASITAFALVSAYLLHKGKQYRKEKQILKSLNQENLNMERYVFTLPSDQGDIDVIVEQGGECYAVRLNGKYAGSMWQDEENELFWHSHDKALQPYVFEIAAKLSEAFSRQGFPSILKGTYPEITDTEWKSSETLEITLKPDIDFEVFTSFLKDEVLNLVSFEEHLDLMVKKENQDYFMLISVN